MIVTLRAPSRREAARAQFECIKFGIECDYMQDNVMNLTVGSIDKAQIIAVKSSSEIIAVTDKMIFDPMEV
mgnify:FL=1